jgi:hypothetical protein
VIENGTRESDPIQALRNGNLMRSMDTVVAPGLLNVFWRAVARAESQDRLAVWLV